MGHTAEARRSASYGKANQAFARFKGERAAQVQADSALECAFQRSWTPVSG
jgi:hypothetical protein